MENSGEIAALLRRRYPAAKVQTVSFDRRPDLTVTEQVRLLWFMGSAGWLGGQAPGALPWARVDGRPTAASLLHLTPTQVQLMSGTSILVTPCGGLATVLTFLRPGATAIAMNYWHSVQQRSLQLEDNYYSHLEYLDLQYMPVTPEDYAATRWGPPGDAMGSVPDAAWCMGASSEP